jgi:hypothetical protein
MAHNLQENDLVWHPMFGPRVVLELEDDQPGAPEVPDGCVLTIHLNAPCAVNLNTGDEFVDPEDLMVLAENELARMGRG